MIEGPCRQPRAWEDIVQGGDHRRAAHISFLPETKLDSHFRFAEESTHSCLWPLPFTRSRRVSVPIRRWMQPWCHFPRKQQCLRVVMTPAASLVPPSSALGLPAPTPFLPSLHHFPWMCEHIQVCACACTPPPWLSQHPESSSGSVLDCELCWGS